MSADAFHVVYGIRWEIDVEDERLVSLFEQRREPRQLAAWQQKLDVYYGVTIDETRHFLLIGKLVGHFGWEYLPAMRITDAEKSATAEQTKKRLLAAGFQDEPAWHFQFEPDR